jgi:hypothetical protein
MGKTDAMTPRAKRAIDALQTPDASLRSVANTVRQSLAEVIAETTLQVDRYGLALMMIAEGCENPEQLARETLAKNRKG